ncbi:brachyurin-like [Hyposmocoma kahamanoa]|uniref:brachyurin-like n=1 Tax=Hyposmocoma kahamanoa TaxID=1477025 RepID=UPI000E6D83B7|nr:brachyurin-like [Hyposmocoma kahamanoa]
MKLFLVLVLVGVALTLPVKNQHAERTIYYHEAIGIKQAARIKAAEKSTDFSGVRIVGGSDAALGQFTFVGGLVITLLSGETSVCGATMLRNNRAVTAAECWWDGRNHATQFTVVYGSLTLFSGGTRVNASSVVMHYGFDPNMIENDVAIIRHGHVGYTNNIRAIPVASGSNLFVGVNAQAVGFGRQADNEGVGTNQQLHHVTLPVITNAICSNTYGPIPASNICTSGAGGRSTCSGDSGGPLAYNGQLIGIVSFGHRAGCQLGHPQAFARVTTFHSWITSRL